LTVNKNAIIASLALACGILIGILLSGFLLPQPVHPVNEVIFTANAPLPLGPYSQAIQSGNSIFLSGQIGIDPATGNLTSGIEAQTTRAMDNLKAVLEESGLSFKDVVSARIYLVNLSDGPAVNGIYASYFNGTYPARATVQVAALPRGALVEIEMVAQKPVIVPVGS
jgi:2-iminobutanoate/2-iminopropanoate deaminase